MAFDVTFYTYSKKTNSLATPASGGTTLSCVANQPLVVTAPLVTIKQTLATAPTWNYMHIPSLGRWYWVGNWVCENGLWSCAGTVDPLASWAANIRAQTLYIKRSASAYDGDLTDQAYPQTGDYSTHKTLETSPFYAAVSDQNSGTFVVGLAGTGSTNTYYAMSKSQFGSFLTALFGDAYAESILTELQLTTWPESKIAINPIQYISSVVYLPVALNLSGMTLMANLPAGPGRVPCSAHIFVDSQRVQHKVKYFDCTDHPQVGTAGRTYLNRPPYTDRQIFVPPFGMIQLDGMILSKRPRVTVDIALDCYTGAAELTVSATGTNLETVLLNRLTSQVGISWPIGQLMTQGFSSGRDLELGSKWVLGGVVGGVISEMGSLASGNLAGGVSNLYNAAMSFLNYGIDYSKEKIEERIGHFQSMGSMGDLASVSYQWIEFTEIFHEVCDFDDADFGRPLMQSRSLSTLSGYVECVSNDIAIPCTAAELETIKAALVSGVFV